MFRHGNFYWDYTNLTFYFYLLENDEEEIVVGIT